MTAPRAPRATEADLAELPGTPWLPPARTVELPGRGTTTVRDTGPRPGAPTVLLLHGWAVTSDLNWFPVYPTLAERYRVIALDHRGHGRGLRPADGIVRLSDCADDAAALLEALEVPRAVVVGYSMGGAIAQLLWRRHPAVVDGLVLGSTARHFQGGPISDLWYRSYTPLALLAHRATGPADAVVRRRIDRRVGGAPRGPWMRAELEQVSPAGLLSAMRSLGRFRSTGWIGDVDVATSVIVTTRDRTVPPRRQRGLAGAIDGARRLEVDGPHDAIVSRAEAYAPILRTAVDHVADA